MQRVVRSATETSCDYLAQDQPIVALSVIHGEPQQLVQWRDGSETVLTLAPGPGLHEGDQQAMDGALVEMAQRAVANLQTGDAQ